MRTRALGLWDLCDIVPRRARKTVGKRYFPEHTMRERTVATTV
jgi:hypothetical protein